MLNPHLFNRLIKLVSPIFLRHLRHLKFSFPLIVLPSLLKCVFSLQCGHVILGHSNWTSSRNLWIRNCLAVSAAFFGILNPGMFLSGSDISFFGVLVCFSCIMLGDI